jgi:hypothetical protein
MFRILYLDSVALNLHGFYTGIERLFELIARHIDESVPSDKNWHRSLLKQMTENYKNYRPAVISQSIFFELDEFRRFRHVVRNVSFRQACLTCGLSISQARLPKGDDRPFFARRRTAVRLYKIRYNIIRINL